jgi:dipeptidyl aminopeptidase/acylaminoacyl peptidase
MLASSLALFAAIACQHDEAATSSPDPRPDPGRLELSLLLDWESVSGPVLSPDGSQVVFTRAWTDKIEDRTRNGLWIMGRDGSRLRHLVEGSGAKWSPDGSRIAYVAEGKPQGSQVFVLWLDTREVTQLTHLTESPSGLAWSPDGRSLAFAMQVPEKDGFEIQLPKKPKGAKWAADATVITRLAYRRDRQGYRPSGYRHLFVVSAIDGGTPRQVTSGDFDHGEPEWSDDGKELLCSGLREPDADWQVRESEIYAVDVERGAVRQLTRRQGPDARPRVSPDGQWVAYLGHDANDDTYNVSELWVMRLDGSQARSLTKDLDRQPDDVHWTADGRALLCAVPSEGTTQVWRVGLDGTRTQLTHGTWQVDLGDVAADGSFVATVSAPHAPGDVWSFAADGKGTKLTDVHADLLARVQLGEVEEIRTKSSDGLAVQGWLVKPPGFDPARKYPLILQIHGGPHAMYGVGFDFERQNHAAAGYLVLYTNPRGSTGYGKAFGNAIDNAYPGKDYDDLIACVDAAIAKGCVDEDNLFVYGGSGGGVLTCWIVGMTDRFRAAVSMFPVTNWISFVGTTDGPSWYENFAKLPWEDISEHWQRSPLRLVGNVKTPTMLLTGELDLRTPMAQTEEYYQALKLRKVDTVMVRIPDEYHGASAKHVSNRMRRILYVRGWFEKYMRREEPAALTSPAAVRGG